MPNKIEKSADGNLIVELETGERFSGDALEVTTKLAEAQVNTKRWGQGFKQELETLKATPPPPPNPPPPNPPPPADANEAQLQQYLLNQHAKALGYENGDQYKAALQRVQGSVEQISTSTAVTQFFTQHPEYPATQEANDYLQKIFDEKGWKDMTADNFHLAHLEAMDRHRRDPKEGYEPLSQEALNSAWSNGLQQSNRPPAPPMLRGNNPEQVTSGLNPYTMPMNDLRKLADQRSQTIEQELNRR